MTKLDISFTNLRAEGGKALCDALKDNPVLKELNVAGNLLTLPYNGKGYSIEGVGAIGDSIKNYGVFTTESLTKFYEKHNPTNASHLNIVLLLTRPFTDLKKALFLKYNCIPKITVVRALVSLNISNNNLGSQGGKVIGEALKENPIMQELNIASNMLVYTADTKHAADKDTSGVIAIRDAISTMGALENLHIGFNFIPAGEMERIIKICTDKPTMKVLCEVPFKNDNISKLDVRGKNLGTEGALVVSEYLKKTSALTDLNISANMICELVLPEGW